MFIPLQGPKGSEGDDGEPGMKGEGGEKGEKVRFKLSHEYLHKSKTFY